MSEKVRFPIFAERFSSLRGNRTQAEFSEFLNISRQTVSFYENGDRIPDALALRDIALKCGVTSDWLLGISDAKTADIDCQRVCQYTGLSDRAVAVLHDNRVDKFHGISLSYLIEEKKCLRYLSNYLFKFVIEQLWQTDFKYVPLKNIPLKYIYDILFSALIRFLPIVSTNVEQKFTQDKKTMDILIMEYLRKNADIKKCKELLDNLLTGVETEAMTCDEEEIDWGTGYDNADIENMNEYIKLLEQEEIEAWAENENLEIKKIAAIEQFLDYISSKEGAINAEKSQP